MMPYLYVAALWGAADVALVWAVSRLKKGRGRSTGMAGLVALNAVFAALFALEIGMALFFAQSDGFNLTMSSQKWFARHWQPVNSLGYRDVEPRPKADGEKLVLVVGDSFAAGHGIDRAEDRFGDVLARELGAGWRVANAAKIGWDTVDEFEALAAYPTKPDVVVLAYFVNDIYRAAEKAKFPLPFAVHFPKSAMAKYVVDHFALANFLYWRLARFSNLDDAAREFWDRLRAAYADPTVFGIHAGELDDIAGWCRERGVRLIVLLIPSLSDVAGSASMTKRVGDHLASRGVQLVDMTALLAGRSPGDMVVNAVDTHANVRLNAEMAGLLRQAILSPQK